MFTDAARHHLFIAMGQWVARRPKVLGTPAALGALMHCDVHVLTHCDVHVLTHVLCTSAGSPQYVYTN